MLFFLHSTAIRTSQLCGLIPQPLAIFGWCVQPGQLSRQIAFLTGAYNRTYSSAPQQPEKDLPLQPLAAEV